MIHEKIDKLFGVFKREGCSGMTYEDVKHDLSLEGWMNVISASGE